MKITPGNEYGVMPFWFWNDRLEAAEIIRQIDDFAQKGVGGFVIHPRIGLPEDMGWMSDALLDFYEVAITHAAKLGLKVILYDEGMYPSGSSAGQVVEENPAYAARCLAPVELDTSAELKLDENENLVALLTLQNGQRVAVVDRKADSCIRGLHYQGEGPEEITHPAGDILNPEAVACFIRLVYDRFAERFRQHFGETIIAIFTDEPSAIGRPRNRMERSGSFEVLPHVNRILGYDFTAHLPCLWYEDEPDAKHYKSEWNRAISLRLEETFYRQLYNWCETNNLPLTGHPSAPDDIGCLRFFQMPGQDLVWRDVLPDEPSALEGAQSTQAKCSSSAALHGGRHRNLNECCGAYGHELTFEEVKWLANWCLIRGVNLIIPHAFYYSIRGVRREERPPDVGPNSPWWDHFHEYAASCRHLSWLNSESQQVCEVAILGTANYLPWRSAKVCFQNQIDFNYVDERDLLDRATITAEGIHMAGMTYRRLITEHDPAPEVHQCLEPFAASGRLIQLPEQIEESDLLDPLDELVSRDVVITPASNAFRIRHVRKNDVDWYLIFNEEKYPQDVQISFSTAGAQGLLDPVSGLVKDRETDDRVRFDGHEMKVFFVRSKTESSNEISI